MATKIIQTKREAKPTVGSRIGRRREVVIPKKIADELRLGVGDAVDIGRDGESVVITPSSGVDPDDALSREEAKAVRQAKRDVAAGRVIGWADYKKTHGLGRKPR